MESVNKRSTCGRNLVLPLFHALVTREQQRFGLGIVLLAQPGLTEQGLCAEGLPGVGLKLRANGRAFLQDRLSFSESF